MFKFKGQDFCDNETLQTTNISFYTYKNHRDTHTDIYIKIKKIHSGKLDKTFYLSNKQRILSHINFISLYENSCFSK